MRYLAHCLILLMAPVAVSASDALGGAARGNCTYAPSETERIGAPAAALNLNNGASAVPTKPSPAQSTGDDDLIPRMRTPKWHRFLPGMFR